MNLHAARERDRDRDQPGRRGRAGGGDGAHFVKQLQAEEKRLRVELTDLGLAKQ